MSDGTLHFPMRGGPPRIMEGYRRSKSNPYVFEPILPACVHRILKEEFFKKCNCTSVKIQCEIYHSINMGRCWRCTDAKSPTQKTCSACHEITFVEET